MGSLPYLLQNARVGIECIQAVGVWEPALAGGEAKALVLFISFADQERLRRFSRQTEKLRIVYILLRKGIEHHFCDFTQFFATPAPVKLPHGFSFKHEVENEKEEILRTHPP